MRFTPLAAIGLAGLVLSACGGADSMPATIAALPTPGPSVPSPAPAPSPTPSPVIPPAVEPGSDVVAKNSCFLTEAAPRTAAPRVVVADIDSGINPYHAFFRAGSTIYPNNAPSSVTPEVLAAFGIDEDHIIDLTRTGNFAADFAVDKPKFDAVVNGELYWFKGTNIIATTFSPGTVALLPDDEGDTHGVGTAASVMTANPDAILLFIEGVSDAAEDFAYTHPMVDIITTSYGTPGSVPGLGHLASSYTGVYCNGKMHFGASDNSPALSTGDGTSGPWWTIGIAGWEEGSSEGRQALSGNFVDFVADFTQNLPYCQACEDDTTENACGTSFATPMSAGIASKILLETRRAWGDNGGIRLNEGEPTMAVGAGNRLTNWQVRRALEVAAFIPSAADWDPISGALEQSLPVNDAAPYVQLGWGLLSHLPEKNVVAEALGVIGVAAPGTRSKSAMFCTYQTQQVASRRALWDNDPQSESFSNPADPDPFLACD